MRVWRVRSGISITLKPSDRQRLGALAGDRNGVQSMSGESGSSLPRLDGLGTAEIMRRRPPHGFKVAASLRAEVDSSYDGRSGRYASLARASDCSKSRPEQPSMNAANDILPKA